MNKKTVLAISIVVNIILALVFILAASRAAGELEFNYVEEETITPETISANLERENYGVAAMLSHPIRGGADIADEYRDQYMLGEYADLLFLKEIFKEAGNEDMASECEKQLADIRSQMPDHGSLLDKMDWSAQNAKL